MGLFSWLLPNKTLAQATLGANYRAAKAALKRGVSAEEVNECLGYAEHAGLPMVKLLVEHGADVNYKPSDGRTPRLHLAAAFGYVEIAEYLLDQGADINALDKDGDTPLDAAFSSPLDREILALHGAPTNPADPAKARRQQAVAALLSSRGGKGGHELPPHLWGPVKSRIEPLVLMAKYNFPRPLQTNSRERFWRSSICSLSRAFRRENEARSSARFMLLFGASVILNSVDTSRA